MIESEVIKTERRANLPDVSKETRAVQVSPLDAVGMKQVELPLLIRASQDQLLQVPAKASVFVSIDREDQRGIHMSRLYKILRDRLSKSELNLKRVRDVMHELIGSQDHSLRGELQLQFEVPLEVSALLSDEKGFRYYPFTLTVSLDRGELEFYMDFQVLYSSTCPCSAALARELVAEHFSSSFQGKDLVSPREIKEWLRSEKNIVATPHAQRSRASLRLKLDSHAIIDSFRSLVESIEMALATPVQTAVKREDEQEFARLNASNLMFCEDAARRIRANLMKDQRFSDFIIKVEHFESLHAHDAVAMVSKGVPGGLKASTLSF